jgi:predicted DsbA family dithiol-disulfide isomerase
MRVDVWSDVVCPWCYIGKRRLEAALRGVDGPVELRWRSFQLDPSAPAHSEQSLTEALQRKYGLPHAEVLAMQERVRETAAAEGLRFDFSGASPANTRAAHRLLHHAQAAGVQDALKERLFAAYFCEGARVGEPEALLALGVEAGLDRAAAAAVLDDPRAFDAEVQADVDMARRLGVRGVPFFVVDGKLGVSGAQPAAVLLDALLRAGAAPAAAPACDDAGCEI